MNEQQKERIFKLLKEIHAVVKEAEPDLESLHMCLIESRTERYYDFFGFRNGEEKESVFDECRF